MSGMSCQRIITQLYHIINFTFSLYVLFLVGLILLCFMRRSTKGGIAFKVSARRALIPANAIWIQGRLCVLVNFAGCKLKKIMCSTKFFLLRYGHHLPVLRFTGCTMEKLLVRRIPQVTAIFLLNLGRICSSIYTPTWGLWILYFTTLYVCPHKAHQQQFTPHDSKAN